MNDNKNSQFHTVRGYQMISQRGGHITSAMEDYLEMIYRICMKDGYARVGKLSELLHVKPSSASKMIFKLTEFGYIQYERYEIIFLTDDGKKKGEFLLNRHNTVADFLELIGVLDTLEETELIEHSLNSETVSRLNMLLAFFKQDPLLKKSFHEFQGSNNGGIAVEDQEE